MRGVFLAAVLLGSSMTSAFAQRVPELPFESVPNPLTLPTTSISARSPAWRSTRKGHVFVFSRGNSTGPAYMAHGVAAARVRRQRQVRAGDRQEPLRLVLRARRADRPAGQHLGRGQGLGRDPQDDTRRAAWTGCSAARARRRTSRCRPTTPPRSPGILERAGVDVDIPPNNNPRNPVPVHRDNVFNQPTDVAWDSQGNSYFTDGYINSRVGQGQRARRVGRQLGLARQGAGPVRHAARHRGVAGRRDLRRRPRQPPHPGVRHRGQVRPRVHRRRAGRHVARAITYGTRDSERERPARRRPARPTRCA